MMWTRVLSTVVLALALLGAPHVVMAQSSDEVAVAQAVEAFRNAMLKADRGQFMEVHHPHGSDHPNRRQYRDRAAHVHGRNRT